jgi:RNA polymerase sigma-70 factor (family 1)
MKKSDDSFALFDTDKFIHAFHQGDPNALKDLFNDLYPPLCYFAAQIVTDKPCAEDLAKDTFVKLWNKRADFTAFPQIKAFLYLTTKNAALNILRHEHVKMRTQKELRYITSGIDDHDTIGLMIKAELMAELVRAKRCLTPQQKKIVDLKYYEGLNNEKVAAKLGVTVSTVKTQIGRALEKLRHYFKNNREAYLLIVALLSSDFDHHSATQNQAATNLSKAHTNPDRKEPALDLRFYSGKVNLG